MVSLFGVKPLISSCDSSKISLHANCVGKQDNNTEVVFLEVQKDMDNLPLKDLLYYGSVDLMGWFGASTCCICL